VEEVQDGGSSGGSMAKTLSRNAKPRAIRQSLSVHRQARPPETSTSTLSFTALTLTTAPQATTSSSLPPRRRTSIRLLRGCRPRTPRTFALLSLPIGVSPLPTFAYHNPHQPHHVASSSGLARRGVSPPTVPFSPRLPVRSCGRGAHIDTGDGRPCQSGPGALC
jgi:hypothetical protein